MANTETHRWIQVERPERAFGVVGAKIGGLLGRGVSLSGA
jgi:hypothetical protein